MSPIRSFHRSMEINGKNEKKRRRQGSFGRKRSEKSRKFDEFAGNFEQADGHHAGSDYERIKVDADSDEYNTEEDSSQSEVLKEKPGVQQKKRLRISEEEPIDLPEQGFNSMDTMIYDEDGVSTSYMKERNSRFNNEQDESIQGRMWMFDMAQREHELKLRMLNIALEKVELQKQTAINELKTSEIKRQLVENQAAEYYR
ncbi:uncharacterized protein LOC100870066 [Apis florea]|uniref:uncharacterized protein LOC100870066 n=1 Tax=Apis florea TaxID=7463 RepID=UPI0012FEFDAA|nr:uncharacterized protein LOC100870066 [Apis florea]